VSILSRPPLPLLLVALAGSRVRRSRREAGACVTTACGMGGARCGQHPVPARFSLTHLVSAGAGHAKRVEDPIRVRRGRLDRSGARGGGRGVGGCDGRGERGTRCRWLRQGLHCKGRCERVCASLRDGAIQVDELRSPFPPGQGPAHLHEGLGKRRLLSRPKVTPHRRGEAPWHCKGLPGLPSLGQPAPGLLHTRAFTA
jgi:hypothetical protein